MKINIFKDTRYIEPEVTVKYYEETQEINTLFQSLHSFCNSVQCSSKGETYNIGLYHIFYFESVEEKTFVYTENEVYECKHKLYELDEMFHDTSYVRVSKSCIVNIMKMKSVRPFINGKFEATMINGEKIIINRHYVADFKKKFNI